MAEGGGGDENPYSFSKFVEKKSKRRRSGEDDPDERNNGRDDTSSESESSPNDDNAVDLLEGSFGADAEKSERKKNPSDNPFSFKKFLQASASNPSRSSPAAQVSGGSASPGNGLLATLDLASDLPDFVQDHYHPADHSSHNSSGAGWEGRLPPADIVQLPDFALDSTAAVANSHLERDNTSSVTSSENNYRFPPGGGIGLPPPDIESFPLASASASIHQRTPRLDNHRSPDLSLPQIYQNNVHSLHNEELPPVNLAASSGGLPDFLPDSALGGSLGSAGRSGRGVGVLDNGAGLGAAPKLKLVNGARSGHSSSDDSDDDAEPLSIRQLKVMNRELRDQLKDAQELALRESARVADTLRELDERHRHDGEETAALELAIQNAERNLEATTQRAVAAENNVVRLKQELSTLQMENESLRRQLITGGCGSSLQEAALYASRQLDLTVKDAEYMLKQLLTGVDSLRVLSSILASADKITDLPPDGHSSHESNRKTT